MQKACLAGYAGKIREALNVPVMAVGRINDPLVADELIEKGMADLICIGRGLLADPEMPKKAKEGRLDDIRRCIACNTCMESIFRRGRVECLVNPVLGREEEMAFHPAKTRKKVMVIGAGPGGLNVAWVAARRGHEVHLFERGDEMGGQLILGSITGYKKELLNLIRFQKRQIERFGVTCHLNQEVTPDTIASRSPDVVILATGSVPVLPPVDGIDKPIVIPITMALDHHPIDRKTVVIGGGAIGCEVALHLSEKGGHVSIVEMLPKIGAQLESMTKKLLIQKIMDNGVKVHTGFKLSRVLDNGVVVEDRNAEERFIEADAVVIAVGSRPDDRLYLQIKDLGYEIHQIGDCLEPRSAKSAIYEGAVLGRSI